MSKTDLPQQWGRPSKTGEEKYKKGKLLNQLFPNKYKCAMVTDVVPVTHQMLINNTNILKIPCSLSRMIKEESISEVERECKSCIDSIIDQLECEIIIRRNRVFMSSIFYKQNQHIESQNYVIFPLNFKEHNFFFEKICISQSVMFDIFNQTINQSECERWNIERKLRLSASVKAHKIKTCKNWTDEGLKHLANILLKENKLGKTGNLNVNYGKKTEGLAIECFKTLTGKDIIKCGLIFDIIRPWICVSPDGLILDEYGNIQEVLEIKCPISCENNPIVDGNKIYLKYLEYDMCGKLVLKKSNIYFTQCQMLIHCTGVESCTLFVYNTIEPVFIKIERDQTFIRYLLERMTFFYFNYYLPSLLFT